MNRHQAELQRLYPDGRVIVLEVMGAAAWERLSEIWRAVQAELELPAPGIAVNGRDGVQLWFSLAEGVAPGQAAALVDGLRRRHLGAFPPERIAVHAPVAGFPPVEQGPGQWSAFVAPDLAALFADEPWLDLPPGTEAQAELLSRLQVTRPADLQRALERLGPAPASNALVATQPAAPQLQDPRRFLLAVMNDPAIELHLRIEAARALLPYFAP